MVACLRDDMVICDKCGAYLVYKANKNGVTYKECPNCGWKYIYPDRSDGDDESDDSR